MQSLAYSCYFEKMLTRSLFLLVLLFFAPLAASAFDVSLSPNPVHQGDAFAIKVTSESDLSPEGSIGKRELRFHRTAPGRFTAISFFGLEQKPDTYAIRIRQGDIEKIIKARVHPLKARTIHLTLADDKVTLSPENEKRANRESRLLKSLWSKVTSRKWEGNFIPPLETGVSTEFGVIRLMNKKKRSVHKGVDYKGTRGMFVWAINGGTVSLTDEHFFGGKTVMIDHGEGLYSLYMHLSKIVVKEGQTIEKSDPVGLVGATGRATGPHLHISVKWLGQTVNPVSLLRLQL